MGAQQGKELPPNHLHAASLQYPGTGTRLGAPPGGPVGGGGSLPAGPGAPLPPTPGGPSSGEMSSGGPPKSRIKGLKPRQQQQQQPPGPGPNMAMVSPLIHHSPNLGDGKK